MSVSLRVTGTWAELTADGTVAIPATPQAGDRMYLFARWKDFSVTATVTNWTELAEFADGSVASGNGTGSVKVGCWYRDWLPGDADPTIDFSASPTNASVVITIMAKGADDVWVTPVARSAAMTTWTTASQSVSASATVTVPSSGVVMGLIGIRDDSAVMTRPANGIDDSGGLVTWNGNYVESPATHHTTTTGDDGAADLGYRLVTTGASGVTLRLTGTISAAETGAALWVVQGVSVTVTPSISTLALTVFAALLRLAITSTAAALNATTFAPLLRLVTTPATTTLAATSSAPQLKLSTTPASADLTITATGPSLHLSTTPATAALTLAPLGPTVATTVFPASATLSLTVFSPTTTTIIVVIVPGAPLTLNLSIPHVLPFRLVYLDPGGDAVQAVGYFNTPLAGATGVTFDNTQQVVGLGSYKFDSLAGGEQAEAVTVNGVLSHDAGVFSSRRVSCYFRYDSVPDLTNTATEFVGASAIYSGGGFTDVEQLEADNELYAAAAPARNAGQGMAFSALGFNIVIPISAAIDSVKIIYERKYDTNTTIGISRVKYRINGEEGPDYDNTDMPLVDTVVTVDLTADRGFSRADLLDGVFEVIAEARRGDTDTAHTQSWDYVKVEVGWHLDGVISARDSADAQDSFKLGLSRKGDAAVIRFVDGLGASYLGITELQVNTWPRISFGYVQRDGGGIEDLDINIYINGIPELSITNASTDSAALFNLRYGWLDSPGAGHVCWVDQLYVDDGDDLQDPASRPRCTAKLSATINEDTWNTVVGTGAVNERPLSTANHIKETRNLLLRQTYTLQAAAIGDSDVSGETLVGYMGWVWGRLSSSSFDNVGLVVNGVEIDRLSEATQQNAGSAPILFRAAFTSLSYPSNAAGIGMISNEFLADSLLYECGAVVAYEGPLNPDILLERQQLVNETLDTIIDDLRADPPDSYEICCNVEEFDGSITIDVYALDQEGGSIQYQGSLNSSGGVSRLRITPGIEVRLDVTVSGVTMIQVYRRVNFE
jgi:hypothetical protein